MFDTFFQGGDKKFRGFATPGYGPAGDCWPYIYKNRISSWGHFILTHYFLVRRIVSKFAIFYVAWQYFIQ